MLCKLSQLLEDIKNKSENKRAEAQNDAYASDGYAECNEDLEEKIERRACVCDAVGLSQRDPDQRGEITLTWCKTQMVLFSLLVIVRLALAETAMMEQ